MRSLAGTFLLLTAILAAPPGARAEGEPCEGAAAYEEALYRRLAELISPGALVLWSDRRPEGRVSPTVGGAIARTEAAARPDEWILLEVAPDGTAGSASPTGVERRVRITKENGVTTARVTGIDSVPDFTARGWKDIRGTQQGELDLPYGIIVGGNFDRRDGIALGPRAEVRLVSLRLSDAELSASAGGSGTVQLDGSDLSGSIGPRTRIYLLVPVDQSGRRFTVDLSGGPEVDIRNRRPSPGGNAMFLLNGTF